MLIERLRQEREVMRGSPRGGLMDGRALMDFTPAELDQIIAALEAAAKLPRTADGVPVVPGMTLYTDRDTTININSWDQADRVVDGLFVVERWIGKVYSTREAAARSAQEAK